MNQDLFLSELRKIALVVIAYATGRGWLSSADSGLVVSLLLPVGLLVGPWIWGTYQLINSKIVPKDSIAVQPIHPGVTAETGVHVILQDAQGGNSNIAKVVGALLAAILLSHCLITPTFAQGFPKPRPLTGDVVKDFSIPKSTAAGGATSFDSALTDFNSGVQKIEKSVVDKGIADLNAAITDATSHNDKISLPCWQSMLLLLQSLPSQWSEPPSLPMGIALSIQIQRDLLNSITGNDEKSLKVACAALIGDQIKIVANVGALLGIRIASGGLL